MITNIKSGLYYVKALKHRQYDTGAKKTSRNWHIEEGTVRVAAIVSRCGDPDPERGEFFSVEFSSDNGNFSIDVGTYLDEKSQRRAGIEVLAPVPCFHEYEALQGRSDKLIAVFYALEGVEKEAA